MEKPCCISRVLHREVILSAKYCCKVFLYCSTVQNQNRKDACIRKLFSCKMRIWFFSQLVNQYRTFIDRSHKRFRISAGDQGLSKCEYLRAFGLLKNGTFPLLKLSRKAQQFNCLIFASSSLWSPTFYFRSRKNLLVQIHFDKNHMYKGEMNKIHMYNWTKTWKKIAKLLKMDEKESSSLWQESSNSCSW